ncbi:MAG: hypothetical protein HF300_16105 [Ignavibacteria bacterium]|jgi:hypothetical protein|nr:hypothetical protein [Ignavibacteria bacterium]HEX2963394.1 hypothetical protein [Ignavibacteriales bacterium]MCU7500243.1 hypothetical protein [Ignavibacteria bacterium]MCU7514083.1 hypothetical protein [Ignavibacteria bacterium]MCU7520853.1 hypothetical protein [Ignavibacteria bacterium]
MDAANQKLTNPLADLISDEVYSLLSSHYLIDEVSVRDYLIRKKFRQMKENNIRTNDAVESLMDEFPHLQFDTIKKIIYHPQRNRKPLF